MMTTARTVYTNANLYFDKKKNRKLANIWPSIYFYGFYGVIFWWKKGLCREMAWLLFQKQTRFYNWILDLYELFKVGPLLDHFLFISYKHDWFFYVGTMPDLSFNLLHFNHHKPQQVKPVLLVSKLKSIFCWNIEDDTQKKRNYFAKIDKG